MTKATLLFAALMAWAGMSMLNAAERTIATHHTAIVEAAQ